MRKGQNLEQFAKRIESRIRQGGIKDSDTMEKIICRHLTGDDVKVSAILIAKWVEWRYGKAKESIEHTGKDGEQLAILVRHIVGTQPSA